MRRSKARNKKSTKRITTETLQLKSTMPFRLTSKTMPSFRSIGKSFLSEKNHDDEYDDEKEMEKERVEFLRWDAKEGDEEAQYELGEMYYIGDGRVKQNYALALKWWMKAAKKGCSKAQNSLGAMYYRGEGVEQNYAEACKWFKKLSKQEHEGAQNNLGVIYEAGEGVEKDVKKALQWYTKSAEQGCQDAKYNLHKLHKKIQKSQKNNCKQIKQNYFLIFSNLKKKIQYSYCRYMNRKIH